MKPIYSLLAAAAIAAPAFFASVSCSNSAEAGEMTLKDAFAGKFLMGVAVNDNQAKGIDSLGAALAARHFNAVVAENVMKCEVIHPEEHRYFWDDTDDFVRFGEENGMFIVGHCLIWHSQCAPWFCVDSLGNDVDPETLKARMKDHIYTIVGRYKGRIPAWDVVNEAILDDGSYRESPFYRILGEEFIPLAFQYAHEADPDAELYYNDYSMASPGKRAAVVKLVNDLRARGLRIDAIGIQGHMGMDYPNFAELEKSIEAYADAGCKVMITEWDMSALPTINTGANISDTVAFMQQLNPYPDSLPDSIADRWNSRMGECMEMFLRHSDVITRVCAWGVTDGDSWKNDWPMEGRTEYPLLFDRNRQPKPFLSKYLNTDPK